MPTALCLLKSSTPKPEAELIDLSKIEDPQQRRLAELRNDRILEHREVKALADKTKKEYQEAVQQYNVLNTLPLTNEQKIQNERFTQERIQRALVCARREASYQMNAEAAIRKYEEAEKR